MQDSPNSHNLECDDVIEVFKIQIMKMSKKKILIF